MQTQNLGYPRIGSKRSLKKACERYWNDRISLAELQNVGQKIRQKNWLIQKEAGIDLIPSNDFSYYDQVLDMSLLFGAIPDRYRPIQQNKKFTELDLYFAMARGYQKDDLDITAMEMTKWYDTNYHYIVPEFHKGQTFKLHSNKPIKEFLEAKALGLLTKPVIIGPLSYLLLGKSKDSDLDPLDLLSQLLPEYLALLEAFEKVGVQWIQIDEPCLSQDLNEKSKSTFTAIYSAITNQFPNLRILLTSYFERYGENLSLILEQPFHGIHLDLVRAPDELETVLKHPKFRKQTSLSLGVVNGRNIWKNDYDSSIALIRKAMDYIHHENIIIAPSCSLLHSPCDLADEQLLPSEIKQWLSFAKQKLDEIQQLKALISHPAHPNNVKILKENQHISQLRKSSPIIHNDQVKRAVNNIQLSDGKRQSPFSIRKEKQSLALQLPLFPTTTIGSFPQTKEVRRWRSDFKKGKIDLEAYTALIKSETKQAIEWQEAIDLDVLVHGEFERNDMVEFFGEKLDGFVFTENGWVQSYGSRCVKPPIIYGDISRTAPMTVDWTSYAQSLTTKPVKGMLTGPVTILQWSFVRDDQPRSETCHQIALAIRAEVLDLEKAGIKIIQVDEPALREGLPLKKQDWDAYLSWAINAFRIASAGVQDETQIHTHMCYSEFNDIIEHIAAMDADVITIECSRSQMELLEAFVRFNYPNDIGPGVYDIHSPRVPNQKEMQNLIKKAEKNIAANQLWVNPDCGLKTRHWEETKKALITMVDTAKYLRKESITY